MPFSQKTYKMKYRGENVLLTRIHKNNARYFYKTNNTIFFYWKNQKIEEIKDAGLLFKANKQNCKLNFDEVCRIATLNYKKKGYDYLCYLIIV